MAKSMVEANRMNTWDQIKQHLSRRVSAESFQNWLSKTYFGYSDQSAMWVTVPNEATKIWMEQEYAEQVHYAIRDLNLPFRSIHYEVKAGGELHREDTVSAGVTELPAISPSAQLNPKFTFENFVVGSCNQFAHAAAKAVAINPSKSYNPLFLYGGVGMGKTHLMHAIGRGLMESYAEMRIVYTTSERFINDMISCMRSGRMSQFHQHYRHADALLVDDIQVLANKERSQEEFYFTFNELFEHQKQIVLSSDAPPKESSGLVERLRSRFEWGLMVDLQPPDLETKMAILDKKAETEGVMLPEEVRIFIAAKTKSNVRELEGALVKLIAYSSVTGAPITLPMAQQVLRYLASSSERRITIESVVRCVAERFSMQQSQLKQKTNARHITYPRQIAMYLIKELTDASLPEIGRAFGGKHHTTVLHSITKIERARSQDPDLNNLIHSLIDSLN